MWEMLLHLLQIQWSKIENFPNEMVFYQLKEIKTWTNADAMATKMEEIQSLLSDEAQQQLMRVVLQEIKSRNAISVEYLNQNAM